jgi:hypothetical protein
VLFCVLFVCKCVLPPGDNPRAVNKYIMWKKEGTCGQHAVYASICVRACVSVCGLSPHLKFKLNGLFNMVLEVVPEAAMPNYQFLISDSHW